VLRSYRRDWLRADVVAGFVLAALLLPQGMAYAQLAGMPPVTGIYATMVPMVVYALVGPSRILVVGPDSAVGPLVAAALLSMASNPAQSVELGSLLAIVVGGVCIVGGVARAGFLTELLSKPVRVGYMNGLALIILVSQIPKLLGFSTDAHTLRGELRTTIDGIDQTNLTSLAIGLVALAVILAISHVRPKLPGIFAAVVLSTLAVSLLDLSVPVVGQLPSGLPTPSVPRAGGVHLTDLLAAAVGIAFVAFADTGSLSRSYAARRRQDVDQNQELIALGVVNVSAGLFQGFPISSSASRTAVAETTGARTQVAGLVAAALMGVVVVAVSGIARNMPESGLAAVVMAAALSLFDLGGVAQLARIRRTEFALCLACFAGVAVFGVLTGIFVAVALSLLDFVRRAWRPHDAVLGRVAGTKGYHDTTRHPEARQIPGLIIYRFDSPLFFANADHFRDHIRELVAYADPPVRWVVVAAEPITDIDTTAAEMLITLDEELSAAGVQLAFAELKGHVRDRLRAYGLADRFTDDRFFPTLGTTVRTYLAVTGVEWSDWEDASPNPT
jgi:high affinity sulfate transporter 1